MSPHRHRRFGKAAMLLVGLALLGLAPPTGAQLMIIGND